MNLDLIICTYNHASLLDRVLKSIAQQQATSIFWRVLVVCNNCTDNTEDIVNKHIKLSRIPHLRQITEPLQGLNHARRCEVQNTTGEWLDLFDSRFTLKILKVMSMN